MGEGKGGGASGRKKAWASRKVRVSEPCLVQIELRQIDGWSGHSEKRSSKHVTMDGSSQPIYARAVAKPSDPQTPRRERKEK